MNYTYKQKIKVVRNPLGKTTNAMRRFAKGDNNLYEFCYRRYNGVLVARWLKNGVPTSGLAYFLPDEVAPADPLPELGDFL